MVAFEERSLTDATHAIGHISFLSEVALVMIRLLDCQPISHPAKGNSGEAWHSDEEDYNGWDLFPAEVVDAAQPWPTPSDAQWAEIETISCRCQNVFHVAFPSSLAMNVSNRHSTSAEFRHSKYSVSWLSLSKGTVLLQHE